jgi:hypothetical protein
VRLPSIERGFALICVSVGLIGWHIAGECRLVEMLGRSEEVDVRKFDQSGMAMATATETGGCGGGVANALCVCECQCFVGWFPYNGVQCGEYKTCTFGATDMLMRGIEKLVRTAEQRRIGH